MDAAPEKGRGQARKAPCVTSKSRTQKALYLRHLATSIPESLDALQHLHDAELLGAPVQG